MKWSKRALYSTCALALLLGGLAQQALAAHAIARFGEPKYPAGFTHFDYVNPDAPKGGYLNLSVISQNSSFDKFNPFSLRGRPAPGLLELIFETLTVNSLDEVNTQYGLLAEDMALADDELSITFRLHAEARFSNGDPVTARDVKYSFDTLNSEQASPQFRAYFSDIAAVIVIDDRHVRFDFARPGRDLAFVAGSLPVFSPRWGLREDGSRVPFDELALETPIASGPYVPEGSGNRLNVTYRRNPDYWGRDLPARRGAFNFDTVVYKLYKDSDTQVAAMRAGDFDFFSETRMRYWCCQFIGRRFDSGQIIKEKVPNHSLSPMNGYAFNLRLEKFQDIRVRRALILAYDWEWLNKNIFDDEFDRQDSYFANSPLAARGLPDEAELALLEPFRDQLDPAVFGPMVELPSTRPPSSPRHNMREALELFAEAGWHFRDGALRNDAGERFVLNVAGSGGVLLDAYYRNLRKMGIEVKLGVSDPVADRARLRRFDFDFRQTALRKNRDPIPEMLRGFNSADANVQGSENIVGLKSPVVDALLSALIEAHSQEELQTAARALDRVLMHGAYLLPWRYLANHYLMYSSRLHRPAEQPSYFGPYEWLLGAWWDGEAEATEVADIH